jgi:hypothetical protein
MRYLVACIATALSTYAVADDDKWTFSPAVELGLHQSEITSPQPRFERQDSVLVLKTESLLTYNSKKISSEAIHRLTHYQYSDTEGVDLSYHDYRWDTEVDVWRNDLVFRSSLQRFHILEDTIQGSFVDEMYSKDRQIVQYKRDYSLRYDLPGHNDIDASFRYVRQDNETKSIADSSREFANIDYSYRTAEVSFGQYQQNFPVYWRVDTSRDEQSRMGEANLSIYEIYGNLKVPIYDGLHIVANAQYEQFENPNSWRYEEIAGKPVKSRIGGGGIAWVKNHNHSYVELTYDVDQSENVESLNADIKWRLADRWNLSLRHFRRFYGDAYFGDFAYTGKRNEFGFNYSENVELRYFLRANVNSEGLYICDPDELGDFSFSNDRCILPPDGDFLLGPGQSLIPNVEVTFPLEARLTLHKEFKFRWNHKGSLWEHYFYVTDRNTEDLEFDFKEESVDAWFEGKWSLNSQSYLRPHWRFRNFKISPGDIVTNERLYSLGYHYELNRRAEWSISLQHLNKNTTDDSFTYNDNRITLTYKHMFGKRHTERRGLYPSRQVGAR